LRILAPDGVEYEITVERAPKVGLWLHGPWRWWSTVTRDSSWWLTVESAAVGRPVIRERYRTPEAARGRSDSLSEAIRSGEWAAPKRPPVRRRRG
jgi:hypothetical protein